jgi:hypothetical protein
MLAKGVEGVAAGGFGVAAGGVYAKYRCQFFSNLEVSVARCFVLGGGRARVPLVQRRQSRRWRRGPSLAKMPTPQGVRPHLNAANEHISR